ncbi:MAG: CopG family transcriptional regulator [Hansschlegelia sp.]
MRTTLTIDDDVLSAARELAGRERRSVGEVLSELARRSLARPAPGLATRNGVPLLPSRGTGLVVTSELIRELLDETS